MKINKQQIEKHTSFLNDIKSEIYKNNGIFTNEYLKKICHNYSLPYGVFKTAIDLGFFRKVSNQNYKIMVDSFQPFHSRQLIVEKRIKHREACKRWKTNLTKRKKKIVKPSRKVIVTSSKPEETKVKTIVTQRQKKFSILWGLIEFKY